MDIAQFAWHKYDTEYGQNLAGGRHIIADFPSEIVERYAKPILI